MPGSGLHTGSALAAAMWTLVTRIGVLFARPLLVFQGGGLHRARPRLTGVIGPANLVLLRHVKSFQVGHGIQPPERRSVPYTAGRGKSGAFG